MKSVYFHLAGGAGGDMLLSSLIELGCPLIYLKEEFKKLSLDFRIKEEKIGGDNHLWLKRLRFEGEKITHYKDVVNVLKKSRLDKDIKDSALAVYRMLADTEKKIHRQKIDNLHFHHLGEIDAILEICGFFLALKYLKISKIYVSFFPLSRPAPAVLALLRGRRIRVVDYEYETVTPTAAALLRDGQLRDGCFEYERCALAWGDCGKGDYLAAYLLKEDLDKDKIVKIETNIDDMNPQMFEFVFDELYKKQAKEVYLEQVLMKKNRPGFVLNVLCLPDDFHKIREVIFKHTTTFGIRYQEYSRDKLKDKFVYRRTKLGKIRFRAAVSEVLREVPEYEDCLKIAKKLKIPLLEVYQQLAADYKI